MLEKGEIDFLYISHEHMDHFWGLPVVMKYNPQIKVLISKSFYAEGKELIRSSGHRGELIELEAGKIRKLFTGCGSFAFDIPIMLRVHGEQGLFFNLKDKGLVTVTGCCHMGVIDLLKAGTNRSKGTRSHTVSTAACTLPPLTNGRKSSIRSLAILLPWGLKGCRQPLHGSPGH